MHLITGYGAKKYHIFSTNEIVKLGLTIFTFIDNILPLIYNLEKQFILRKTVMKNKYWSQLNRKQKIDYYFQYYFSWTLAAIAVIAFVAFYAYQVLSKIPPDISVITVGEIPADSDTQTALVDYITANIDDIIADEEKYVEYNPISYNLAQKNEQNLMHMNKYMALLGEGDPKLLIMDKTHYESALIDEQFDGFLTDLSDLTDNHYKKYAIPVSETKLFDDEGLDFFDEYYVVLTQIGGGKEESGKNLNRWNGAKQFINDILK